MTPADLRALAARCEAAQRDHKNKSSCCGERDGCGTCCAPACMFGDVQRALHDSAAALRAIAAGMEGATDG